MDEQIFQHHCWAWKKYFAAKLQVPYPIRCLCSAFAIQKNLAMLCEFVRFSSVGSMRDKMTEMLLLRHLVAIERILLRNPKWSTSDFVRLFEPNTVCWARKETIWFITVSKRTKFWCYPTTFNGWCFGETSERSGTVFISSRWWEGNVDNSAARNDTAPLPAAFTRTGTKDK